MFTYDEYIRLIQTLKNQTQKLWIRHDVDFSINKALQFAEFESQIGVKSTYYILVNGNYYNPYQSDNLQKIKMIRELGHGVGIHYDLTAVKSSGVGAQSNNIQAHRALLEHGIMSEIKYVTFHKPMNGVPPSYDLVTEMANVDLYYPDMNKDYKYISDSGCNWREDPYQTSFHYPNIQINTHPVWWTETEMDWESKIHGLKLDIELDKSIIKEISNVRLYRENLQKRT